MPHRKVPLVTGKTYHVLSKSIAGFKVFYNGDYQRFLKAMVFYYIASPPCSFRIFQEINKKASGITPFPHISITSKKLIKLVAFCLMPTHIHFILQQLVDNGISQFMNLLLKSYSLYFNIKINRRGPLWEGRFKNVLVETDEQLLHLTRYIHLNPTTAHIVDIPKNWPYSSYGEYLNTNQPNRKICNFGGILDIDSSYEVFVNDNIGYQRDLAKIKHLILE